MARGLVKGIPSGTGKGITGAIQKDLVYGESISSKMLAIAKTEIGIYERSITIDSSKIGTVLTNYPSRVELTSSNFDFSKVREDGNDIRFLDGLDNLIPFEKTYFNKSEQSAVFDVKIATVSSSLNTVFSMVYGDDSSNDKSNKTETWNDDYEAVLHLGESLEDSTGNGNNGTNVGTTVVEGISGKARNFNGSSRINLNDSTLTDNTGGIHNTTIQAIVNQDDSNLDQSILTYRGQSENLQMNYFITNSGVNNNYPFYDTFPPSGGAILFNQTVPINTFNLIQASISQNSNFAKLDINKLTSDSVYSETYTGSKATSLNIGALSSPSFSNFFRGKIQEVRILKNNLSDDWRLADYYNLLEKSLISIGPETGGGSETTKIFATTDISELQNATELVVTEDSRIAEETGSVLSILR